MTRVMTRFAGWPVRWRRVPAAVAPPLAASKNGKIYRDARKVVTTAETDIWAAGMRSSDAKVSCSRIRISFLAISSIVANGIHAEPHADPI